MDYSKYPLLKVEKSDNGITVVKLNNPEQLNAFAGTMHRQIEDVFGDLAVDPDVHIVISVPGKEMVVSRELKHTGHKKADIDA